jgi:hypothetical protein
VATRHSHTKLLDKAARETLKPLGVKQRGRSRIWLDDNGWWLGVVYFKPSGYSRLSDLEMNVTWMWNRRSDITFDLWEVIRFHSVDFDVAYAQYESDEQFAPLARRQATVAADAVLRTRLLLSTLEAAADVLRQRIAPPDLSSLARGVATFVAPMNEYFALQRAQQPPSRQELDAAVAFGLTGAVDEAAQIFDHYLQRADPAPKQEWREERQRAHVEEHKQVQTLADLLHDPERFREQVRSDIARRRTLLKLSPAEALPF